MSPVLHPDNQAELGYTSPEACSMAGVTYRQLDYWVRKGMLYPGFGEGTGNPRWWPASEVEIARRMGCLAAAGLPLDFAARMARDSWPAAELAPGIKVTARKKVAR
jgi:hypothetical protein